MNDFIKNIILGGLCVGVVSSVIGAYIYGGLHDVPTVEVKSPPGGTSNGPNDSGSGTTNSGGKTKPPATDKIVIAERGNVAGASGIKDQHPALPQLSHLQVRAIDPHICEKPGDAYYGNWGPEQPGSPMSARIKNPEFLFDTRHENEGTINWANGFSGTVPACFVVDNKGTTSFIWFPQSPGGDVENRLKAKISAWRYRAGTLNRNYRDTPHLVPVEMAVDFIFSK